MNLYTERERERERVEEEEEEVKMYKSVTLKGTKESECVTMKRKCQMIGNHDKRIQRSSSK